MVAKADKKWEGLAWTPITNFYFTDEAPFAVVKVYITVPHVHEIPQDDIKFMIDERSCELMIRDMNSVNLRLQLNPLWSYVIPSQCDIVVKKNKLIIKIVKKDMNHNGPWQKLQVT